MNRPRHRPTFFHPHLEHLEDRLTMSGPGANNPGALPPQSHPFGATYGEWAARWWQWAYKQPVSTNPLFDQTGAAIANGQSGKVWFLAGVINVSGTADRTGTIPAGKALFFPILNFEADNLCPPIVPPLDVAGLRALATASLAGATLEADVDGRMIQDPQQYHETSPVFSVTFPNNNVFQFFGCNVPAGTYSLPDGFVDEGYYLMLAPLSAGQHTIHFHASVPAVSFTLDITYHITVVGGAGAGAGGPASALASAASAVGGGVIRVAPAGPASSPGATALDPAFAWLVVPSLVPTPSTALGATEVAPAGPAPSPGATALDPAFAAPWDMPPLDNLWILGTF
jgi:hypothetical protein